MSVAWVAVGATVLGAAANSSAAKSAANKQATAAENANQSSSEAARYAADLQNKQYQQGLDWQKEQFYAGMAGEQAMYDQARADSAGTRLRGENAGNRLADLMGLSGNAGAQGYGSLSRNFSASDMQTDPIYSQLQPNIQASINRMTDFQAAPGYQFRLSEGQRGVENSAAARGSLLSGAALKALTKYNQDFASNEYGNWFNQSNTDRQFVADQGNQAYNRFNTNQTKQYNQLAGVAGTGQNATQQIGQMGMSTAQSIANQGNSMANSSAQMGMNYANNVGNLYTNNANTVNQNNIGAANASAAAGIAQANNFNTSMNNMYGIYQQNQLMNMVGGNKNVYSGSGNYTGGSTWGVN